LKYYKDFINHNLASQEYLFNIMNLKDKMSIAKN
jgi:hypothetical protein